MAKEIGHALIRAGLIHKPLLDEISASAIKQKHTLSEQLVLDGVIDDEAITEFYCSKFMVPRIPDHELGRFSKSAVDSIPADMAQELRVVPISIDKEKTMTLLMSDPANYQTVEEIAFHTHHYVVRAVATQKQLAWCLNHYYDIDSALFKSLPTSEANVLEKNGKEALQQDAAVENTINAEPSNKIIVDLHASKTRAEQNLTTSGQIAVMTPLPPSDDVKQIAKKNTDSLPLVITSTVKNDVEPAAPDMEDATESVIVALRQIDRAKTRDAVVEATLQYLAKTFKTTAFLATHKKRVEAWMVVTDGKMSKPKGETPLKEGSLFGDVVATRLPYSGKIYDDDSLSLLMNVLGPSKNHFLLIPVSTRGKVIGILVAYHARVEPSSEQMAVVLKATTGALKKLIIQKKVRLATQDT